MIGSRHAFSLISTAHERSLPTKQKGRLMGESETAKSAVIGCPLRIIEDGKPNRGGVELGMEGGV
jgi:hypothetical protein